MKLQDFTADATTLSLEAFRAKHGELYLVLMGTPRRHAGLLMTMPNRNAADAVMGGTTFEVWPLNAEVGGERTIGRARNNDIVVPDSSVSSFHAAVLHTAKGWCVHDGDSRNGTRVNGASAPARGEGDPLPIEPRHKVSVGSVDLIVLDAQQLVGVAQKLARAKG